MGPTNALYGADIDPADYLTEEVDGFTYDDVEYGETYSTPARSPSMAPVAQPIVPAQDRPKFQMPAIDLAGLANGVQRHYPKIFWFLIVPSTALGLLGVVLGSFGTTDTAIQTPLSNTTREQVLQTAVAIVLDQPIQTTSGPRAATAAEQLDAAKRVMADQENELVQKKANELAIAMTLGMGETDHPCYQQTLLQCLLIQERFLDERNQTAIATNDTDTLLEVIQIRRALDRIRENRNVPHQYQADLYKFARVKYLTANQQIQQMSADGVSQSLMQMMQQQSSAHQAGQQFNPQTGQLEPVTQP